MKETPVSTLEREFLLESLKDGKRIDGRTLDERRNLEIQLGREYGTCLAILGETRVLATVSASVCEPTPSRPCEGILQISIDFLPMCAPRFSDARSSMDDEATEVVRILERCLKESKCIDLESLCIVAEEKVWAIRLNLKVLNHEGCIADCASVAGLAALAHFRRPDVTLHGDVITIHPIDERDPVPLAIHHYPTCSTYAFFTQTGSTEDRIIMADPNHQEEAVMAAKLVLGVNPYREICTLHLAGRMVIEKELVIRLAQKAVANAKHVVDIIKASLSIDKEDRSKGNVIGLGKDVSRKSIKSNEEQEAKFNLEKLLITEPQEVDEVSGDGDEAKIIEVGNGHVEMIMEDESVEASQLSPEVTKNKLENRNIGEKRKSSKSKDIQVYTVDSDSEEEEVAIIGADQI